ncbi:hypothetical protein RSAG8_09072, partial [Rhizoctonia solani AG-8 WAC10335]
MARLSTLCPVAFAAVHHGKVNRILGQLPVTGDVCQEPSCQKWAVDGKALQCSPASHRFRDNLSQHPLISSFPRAFTVSRATHPKAPQAPTVPTIEYPYLSAASWLGNAVAVGHFLAINKSSANTTFSRHLNEPRAPQIRPATGETPWRVKKALNSVDYWIGGVSFKNVRLAYPSDKVGVLVGGRRLGPSESTHPMDKIRILLEPRTTLYLTEHVPELQSKSYPKDRQSEPATLLRRPVVQPPDADFLGTLAPKFHPRTRAAEDPFQRHPDQAINGSSRVEGVNILEINTRLKKNIQKHQDGLRIAEEGVNLGGKHATRQTHVYARHTRVQSIGLHLHDLLEVARVNSNGFQALCSDRPNLAGDASLVTITNVTRSGLSWRQPLHR